MNRKTTAASRGNQQSVVNAPAPKERPILFSGPMVRAILDGRKTQTRRIIKAKDSDPSRCITMPTLMQNVSEWRLQDGRWFGIDGYDSLVYADCPYGQPGDRLWVRESFRLTADDKANGCVQYAADRSIRLMMCEDCGYGDPVSTITHDHPMQMADDVGVWKPSIHIPRWASRITLEITDVRIERLQDISEEDAKAEGADKAMDPSDDVTYDSGGSMTYYPPVSYRHGFSGLWQSINGPESWAANPWDWVVDFKRV